MKKNILIVVVLLVVGAVLIGLFRVVGISSTAVTIKTSDLSMNDVQPLNLKIKDISNNSALITWQTNRLTNGYVLGGLNPSVLQSKYYHTEGKDFRTGDYVIRLTDLLPGRKYYFVVVSNDIKYGKNNEPLEFITKLE